MLQEADQFSLSDARLDAFLFGEVGLEDKTEIGHTARSGHWNVNLADQRKSRRRH
jgi:hypothetical protein